MRRCGTWAKHAGVPLRLSVLLRALGDVSPHLKAGPAGGRLRPAVTTRGAIYRPELRTSSQTSAQISRTASDCHMTTANAIRPATTSRRSQGQARLTRSPFRSCFIHSSSTSRAVEAAPRGVVGFEVDRRCLLAAVDRGDTASIAGWFALGHGPSDRSWRWPDCHSSCMSAAGLRPAPIGRAGARQA
jgi:hypothetical protein